MSELEISNRKSKKVFIIENFHLRTNERNEVKCKFIIAEKT